MQDSDTFYPYQTFLKKTLSGFAILSNLLYLSIFSPVKINSLHSWELLSLTVLDIIECPDKNWARRWNCFRHYSSPYLKYYWSWYIEGFSGRENLSIRLIIIALYSLQNMQTSSFNIWSWRLRSIIELAAAHPRLIVFNGSRFSFEQISKSLKFFATASSIFSHLMNRRIKLFTKCHHA